MVQFLQKLSEKNDGLRRLIVDELLRFPPGSAESGAAEGKSGASSGAGFDLDAESFQRELKAGDLLAQGQAQPAAEASLFWARLNPALRARHAAQEMFVGVATVASRRVDDVLTSLFLELMFDPLFKSRFAELLTRFYLLYMESLSRTRQLASLDKTTVQIFTVETLVLRLIRDARLVETLLTSIFRHFSAAFMAHNPAPRDFTDSDAPSLPFTISRYHPLIETGMYNAFLHDIKFVLEHHSAARVCLARVEIVMLLLKIVSFVHGMNRQRRILELGAHIPNEYRSHERLFHLECDLITFLQNLLAPCWSPRVAVVPVDEKDGGAGIRHLSLTTATAIDASGPSAVPTTPELKFALRALMPRTVERLLNPDWRDAITVDALASPNVEAAFVRRLEEAGARDVVHITLQLLMDKEDVLDGNGPSLYTAAPIVVRRGLDGRFVSLHYPLHRVLALGLLTLAGRFGCGLPQLGALLRQHQPAQAVLPRLVEPPLCAAVFSSQVRLGLWARNGVDAQYPVEVYFHNFWFHELALNDLHLLQFCSYVAPPTYFVSTVISRFGVAPFFAVRRPGAEAEPSVLLPSTPKPEALAGLALDALTLLINIAGRNSRWWSSDEQLLRYEVLQVLSPNDSLPFSGVTGRLPPHYLRVAGGVERALEEVATFTPPTPASPGSFTALPELADKMDMYFLRNRSRERNALEQKLRNLAARRKRAQQVGPPPLSLDGNDEELMRLFTRASDSPNFLAGVAPTACLRTPLCYAIIYSCLTNAVDVLNGTCQPLQLIAQSSQAPASQMTGSRDLINSLRASFSHAAARLLGDASGESQGAPLPSSTSSSGAAAAALPRVLMVGHSPAVVGAALRLLRLLLEGELEERERPTTVSWQQCGMQEDARVEAEEARGPHWSLDHVTQSFAGVASASEALRTRGPGGSTPMLEHLVRLWRDCPYAEQRFDLDAILALVRTCDPLNRARVAALLAPPPSASSSHTGSASPGLTATAARASSSSSSSSPPAAAAASESKGSGAEDERARRRREAKERQEALMKSFAAKQKEFSTKVAAESSDTAPGAAAAGPGVAAASSSAAGALRGRGRALECAICFSDAASSLESPLGLVAFAMPSGASRVAHAPPPVSPFPSTDAQAPTLGLLASCSSVDDILRGLGVLPAPSSGGSGTKRRIDAVEPEESGEDRKRAREGSPAAANSAAAAAEEEEKGDTHQQEFVPQQRAPALPPSSPAETRAATASGAHDMRDVADGDGDIEHFAIQEVGDEGSDGASNEDGDEMGHGDYPDEQGSDQDGAGYGVGRGGGDGHSDSDGDSERDGDGHRDAGRFDGAAMDNEYKSHVLDDSSLPSVPAASARSASGDGSAYSSPDEKEEEAGAGDDADAEDDEQQRYRDLLAEIDQQAGAGERSGMASAFRLLQEFVAAENRRERRAPAVVGEDGEAESDMQSDDGLTPRRWRRANNAERPVAAMSLRIVASGALRPSAPLPVADGRALSLQTCGHALHFECYHAFLLQQNDLRDPELSSSQLEFKCPACRRIANMLLPVVPCASAAATAAAEAAAAAAAAEADAAAAEAAPSAETGATIEGAKAQTPALSGAHARLDAWLSNTLPAHVQRRLCEPDDGEEKAPAAGSAAGAKSPLFELRPVDARRVHYPSRLVAAALRRAARQLRKARWAAWHLGEVLGSFRAFFEVSQCLLHESEAAHRLQMALAWAPMTAPATTRTPQMRPRGSPSASPSASPTPGGSSAAGPAAAYARPKQVASIAAYRCVPLLREALRCAALAEFGNRRWGLHELRGLPEVALAVLPNVGQGSRRHGLEWQELGMLLVKRHCLGSHRCVLTLPAVAILPSKAVLPLLFLLARLEPRAADMDPVASFIRSALLGLRMVAPLLLKLQQLRAMHALALWIARSVRGGRSHPLAEALASWLRAAESGEPSNFQSNGLRRPPRWLGDWMALASLPLLRMCALLKAALRDASEPVPPPLPVVGFADDDEQGGRDQGDAPDESRVPELLRIPWLRPEYASLCAFLGISSEDAEARWITRPRAFDAVLASHWLRSREPYEQVLLADVTAIFSVLPRPPTLLALPRDFHSVYRVASGLSCERCGSGTPTLAVCLLCGKLVCYEADCCPGEVTRHVRACGNGTGLLFHVRLCAVIAYSASRLCMWGSLYIDSHGEEDINVRRGKPLTLSLQRVEELALVWAGNAMLLDGMRRWQQRDVN